MTDEPNEKVIKLSQSTDYLGFLNKQLRDLRGISTLANELIQNADDVPDATKIEFDITDDKLIVSNDSTFSDCGHADQYQCAYGETGSRKMCDFHAFRNIASGHKREENDTTGAFGVGFISVYQITDSPSLHSGGWHWTLFPDRVESDRIDARIISPKLEETRFELPWASVRSQLRIKLDVDPVDVDFAVQMRREMPRVLKAAAPFLKRLETLTLKSNGIEIFSVSCIRDDASDEILVSWDDKEQYWRKIQGNFDIAGERLRRAHRAIEDKRKTGVTVAVPIGTLTIDENSDGLFYAALPTEQSIGIPVLINADFFPSTDRKRLLFDGDYQSAWNCAAIEAAACTLAENLLTLRDCLKPADLWQLFMKARELHRLVDQKKVIPALASFWNCIKHVIETEKVVYTVEKDWLHTGVVRNLQKLEEEEVVIPFLTSLGCQIVHPDLRSSYALLNECNVSLLGISDIIEAMHDKGLDTVLAESDIPVWLKTSKNRETLGQEIERLLQRVKKDEYESVKAEVLECSLVMTSRGELAPPLLVRKSIDGTKELFEHIDPDFRWAANNNCSELLGLVQQFDLEDAISLLEQTDEEALARQFQEDRSVIKRLIRWLVSHAELIAADSLRLNQLRELSIWPSGESLRPLAELSVPGDFEDPLHLASLLDMEMVESRNRSFLIEFLGAQELTLVNYVTQHIPLAFRDESSLEDALKQKLVALLSMNIGQIKDNDECFSALRRCELVACTDGEYRKPSKVYFDSDIVCNVLGNGVSIAQLPDEAHEATQDLYEWLGVSELPRTVDIMGRVEQLTETPPSDSSRKAIANIISGVASHWEVFEEDVEELEELREIAWLPGKGSDRWLKASEVYSTFRQYLFSTQAIFLDIDRSIENAATELLKFLNIQSEPLTKQVIDHLLEMARQKDVVNPVVYTFLNDHAAEELINLLAKKDCLLLEGGRYVSPSHVFWSQHPFGQYREKLGDDWRKHSSLLHRIGVKNEPDIEDAIAVLLEISAKFGEYNAELDEEIKSIVLNCWQILSRALNEGDEEEHSKSIKALGNEKAVPDGNSMLCLPESIFFEDRPRLAKRFEEGLAKHIIKKPEGAGEALTLTGVRPLSDAVSTELVECSNQRPSSQWNNLIQSRLVSLRRVLSANSDLQSDDKVLRHIECLEVDELKLAYTLDFLGRSFKGEQESVLAHWDADQKKLFIRNTGKPAGEVARELAFSVCSDASASQLAPGLKEVLSADSAEEAEQSLDELGFPPGEQQVDHVSDSTDYGVGGEETGEEWTRPTDTPDADVDRRGTAGDDSAGLPSTNELSGGGATGTPAGGAGSPHTPGTGGASGRGSGGSRAPRIPSGGRSRSDKVSRKIKQRTRNQRVSYVSPEKLDKAELENQEQAESKAKETGDKAEKIVVQYESEYGREPHRMPPNNPGYDIESVNPETGEVAYIEVKGTEEFWDGYGVAISQTQYEFAKEHGDSFWLYIVEDVSSAAPKVYPIKNPVAKINKYIFDYGWRNVAEDENREDSAEEQTLDHLVDELKECTEGVFREIVDYCYQNELPLPEVGYESMNEMGEVIDEELELAWPTLKVGVYASDDFDISTYEGQDWQLFSRDVAHELDVLSRALNEEAHE